MKAIVIPTKASLIAEAVMFLVVGILLCCSVSLDSILNIILGIILLLTAVIMVVSKLIEGRSLLSGTGILAAFYGSVGILCFIGNLIPVTQVMIMFLIVVSAFLLVDSLSRLFRCNFKGKSSTFGYIELVVGVIGLTLGLCLWFINDFRQFSGIILGVIFILLGLVVIIDLIAMNKRKAK